MNTGAGFEWVIGWCTLGLCPACSAWVSATAKSLFLSNDHPYFICCWFRCLISLFLSALGPTATTVAEMLCLKGHETNNVIKHSILSKAKAVQNYFCPVRPSIVVCMSKTVPNCLKVTAVRITGCTTVLWGFLIWEDIAHKAAMVLLTSALISEAEWPPCQDSKLSFLSQIFFKFWLLLHFAA